MEQFSNLRESLPVLAQLTDSHTPQWGSMTPQHMVEHLNDSVRISYGAMVLPSTPDDRRAAVYRRFLYSPRPLPHNVDNPLLAGRLQPLRHPTLAEALAATAEELGRFYTFFASNPDARYPHPYFGFLSFEEWLLFHRKHFTHHCTQFGLLPSTGGATHD